MQNLNNLIKGLMLVFISAVLVLLFTPLGFPYSGDLSAPAPQRYMISVSCITDMDSKYILAFRDSVFATSTCYSMLIGFFTTSMEIFDEMIADYGL